MSSTQAQPVPRDFHFGVVAGRALLGALFLVSGILKIGRFAGVTALLAALGLPFAEGIAALVIAVEVGAGAALVLGWQPRLAAAALAAFVVLATPMFHAFWTSDAASYSNQLNHFLKNIAQLGALLMVAGAGVTSRAGRRAGEATAASRINAVPRSITVARDYSH